MDLISLGINSFIFFVVVIPGLLILATIALVILSIPFIVIAGIAMEVSKTRHSTPIINFDGTEPLFEDAVRLVCQYDKASASLLQRRLEIGYARAARLLDQLEESRIIAPGEGSKPRDVLVKNAEEFLSKLNKESKKIQSS